MKRILSIFFITVLLSGCYNNRSHDVVIPDDDPPIDMETMSDILVDIHLAQSTLKELQVKRTDIEGKTEEYHSLIFKKYGVSKESAYVFSVYGLLLLAVFNKIDAGYKYGKLAMETAKKVNNKLYYVRTLQVFNLTIAHWKNHAKETIQPFIEAFKKALEVGDLEYFGNNVHFQFHAF